MTITDMGGCASRECTLIFIVVRHPNKEPLNMLVYPVCTQVTSAIDTHLRGQGRSKKLSIMLGNTLSNELRGNHCENFGRGLDPPPPPLI